MSSLHTPCPCPYCSPHWGCPFLPLHLWTTDTHFQAQLKFHVLTIKPSQFQPCPPHTQAHGYKHILADSPSPLGFLNTHLALFVTISFASLGAELSSSWSPLSSPPSRASVLMDSGQPAVLILWGPPVAGPPCAPLPCWGSSGHLPKIGSRPVYHSLRHPSLALLSLLEVRLSQ